jgi:hypothetical protein
MQDDEIANILLLGGCSICKYRVSVKEGFRCIQIRAGTYSLFELDPLPRENYCEKWEHDGE